MENTIEILQSFRMCRKTKDQRFYVRFKYDGKIGHVYKTPERMHTVWNGQDVRELSPKKYFEIMLPLSDEIVTQEIFQPFKVL